MLNEQPTKKSTFRGGYQQQGRRDTLTTTHSKSLLSTIESSKINSNDSNQVHGRRTLVSAAHETIMFNDLYQSNQQSSSSYGRCSSNRSRHNDDSRQQQQQQRPSWKKSMISDPRESINTIVVSDSSIPSSSSDTSAFVPFPMNVNPIKSIQQRIPPKKLPSNVLSFWMSPSEQKGYVVSASSLDTSISSLSNNNSFDGQLSNGNNNSIIITNNRFNRNNDHNNNGDNNCKDDQHLVRNPFSDNNIQRTKGCQRFVSYQNHNAHGSISNKRSSYLRTSEPSKSSYPIPESGNNSSNNQISSRSVVLSTQHLFDGQQIHENRHPISTNTDNNKADNRNKDDQIMVRNPFDYSNYYVKNNDNQKTKRCRTYVPIQNNHYDHISSRRIGSNLQISEPSKSSNPIQQESENNSNNEILSRNVVSSGNDVTISAEKRIKEEYFNNNSISISINHPKKRNERSWIQHHSSRPVHERDTNLVANNNKVNEEHNTSFQVPVEIELNIIKTDETSTQSNLTFNSLKNHPYNETIRSRSSLMTSNSITSSSSSHSNLSKTNVNHQTVKDNVSTMTRSSIHNNKVKRPHPTRSRQFVYPGTTNVSSSATTIQQHRDTTTTNHSNNVALSSPDPSPEHSTNDVDDDATINSTMIFDMLKDDFTNEQFQATNATDIEAKTLMEDSNKMAFPLSLPILSLRNSSTKNRTTKKQQPVCSSEPFYTVQEQKPPAKSAIHLSSASSCLKKDVEIHCLKRKIDELSESMERLMRNQMSLQEHVRLLEQQQR